MPGVSLDILTASLAISAPVVVHKIVSWCLRQSLDHISQSGKTSWINTRANQVWKIQDFLPLVNVLPENKSTTSGFKKNCLLHLILGTLVWRCSAFVPNYSIIISIFICLHNTANGLFGQSKSRANQNWEHLGTSSRLKKIQGFSSCWSQWLLSRHHHLRPRPSPLVPVNSPRENNRSGDQSNLEWYDFSHIWKQKISKLFAIDISHADLMDVQ